MPKNRQILKIIRLPLHPYLNYWITKFLYKTVPNLYYG